jgi:hypothetical protein
MATPPSPTNPVLLSLRQRDPKTPVLLSLRERDTEPEFLHAERDEYVVLDLLFKRVRL